jgi:hypothetical protein
MSFTRTLNPWRAASTPVSLSQQCIRCLHHQMPKPVVPPPVPFVPDTQTFLTAIGRGMSAHASKFPTWASLFTMSSAQMREAGVEPPRARRYLLWWRERYRNGEYGIGGDFTHVEDGVAELRVVEVPEPGAEGRNATATKDAGVARMVANVPIGSRMRLLKTPNAFQPAMIQLKGANLIRGPHVKPIKGTDGLSAQITMKEGIWEEKRGRKVDGGERRKAEVRFKRKAAERKAA